MPLYESQDLLGKVKAMALRPVIDERADETQWFKWITSAQEYWLGQISVHAPDINAIYEKMTSADGGLTYTTAYAPIGHIEVLRSLQGPPLTPGPFWSSTADFCPEGQRIRMCGGRTRTFTAGPYARYTPMSDVINSAVEPTLLPVHMRALIVPRTCVMYASAGGLLDPSPFIAEEQRLWCGDPRLAGDTGFLGQLKTMYWNSGAASVVTDGGGDWWRSSADFGVGR